MESQHLALVRTGEAFDIDKHGRVWLNDHVSKALFTSSSLTIN